MNQTLPLKTARNPQPTPTSMDAVVLHNRPYTDHYWHLGLRAPSIAALAQPGQFVMITPARDHETGPVLPRPMAVYTRNADAGMIDICYGIVGEGTQALTTFTPGESLVVTGPLGQGFRIYPETTRVLLLGRGIGTCSLTSVAQDFARSDAEVLAVLSGRGPASVIGAEVLRAHHALMVCQVNDADGTSEVAIVRERLLRELANDPPQQILTGGSHRLARLATTLANRWSADVQVAIEAHMACGMGYCHGCVTGVVGREEPPLVCRDGPVFTLDTTQNR